jgi:hypothetical protein
MRTGKETSEEDKARFASRELSKRLTEILGDAPDIVFERRTALSVSPPCPRGLPGICGRDLTCWAPIGDTVGSNDSLPRLHR